MKKLGFVGLYLIFLFFDTKHTLWVLVRTASARLFYLLPCSTMFGEAVLPSTMLYYIRRGCSTFYHALLCSARLFYLLPCSTIFGEAVLPSTMLYYIRRGCSTFYHALLCSARLFYLLPCSTMFGEAVLPLPCSTMFCEAVLSSTMLYYVRRGCSTFYYALLCSARLFYLLLCSTMGYLLSLNAFAASKGFNKYILLISSTS